MMETFTVSAILSRDEELIKFMQTVKVIACEGIEESFMVISQKDADILESKRVFKFFKRDGDVK